MLCLTLALPCPASLTPCSVAHCNNELWVLDTETMEWSQPEAEGPVPPPRAGGPLCMLRARGATRLWGLGAAEGVYGAQGSDLGIAVRLSSAAPSHTRHTRMWSCANNSICQ